MYNTVRWEGRIPAMNSIPFSITHSQTTRRFHVQEIDTHTHREFELYINLSGDISFLAENRLYPLSRGDVFFARPGERHHCVYRSDAPHEFFWLLFDGSACAETVAFLLEDLSCNYFSPDEEHKEELIATCFSLLQNDLPESERHYYFFHLLHQLKKSARNPLDTQRTLPEDLSRMLSFVEQHLHVPFTVADMAKALYLSQSTIERRFKEHLGLPPLAYVNKRKLQNAATRLREGASVSETALSLGFSATSHFISLFEKQYGLTPHQYKKRY